MEGGNTTAVTSKYAASLDAVQKGKVPWPLVGIAPLFPCRPVHSIITELFHFIH